MPGCQVIFRCTTVSDCGLKGMPSPPRAHLRHLSLWNWILPGTNACWDLCSISFHPSVFRIWAVRRSQKKKGQKMVYVCTSSLSKMRAKCSFKSLIKGSESWGGIWCILGLNVRGKKHVYIANTGYVLDLSWAVCLLADTRAVTLSCHAPTLVRTSMLSLWPRSSWCKDHMVVLLCRSWVAPEVECVFISLFHHCKAKGKPSQSHDRQQEVSHQSSALLTVWHPPNLYQLTLTVPYMEALFLAHVHDMKK